MICPSCKKINNDNQLICFNCGKKLNIIPMNNKMSSNGRNSEYITEKYNMKKGVYDGKHNDSNSELFKGIIFVLAIILIIGLIVIAKYII